jgi:hypothetical protein
LRRQTSGFAENEGVKIEACETRMTTITLTTSSVEAFALPREHQ